MRKLVLSLISLGLVSCATQTPDPWQGLETEIEAATTPLDCGSFPLPSEEYKTHVVYDKASLNDLNDYRQCSEANEGIAGEHAMQIDQLKIARKGLTEAGQAQRNVAEMRQTMLNDERRHNLFMSLGYWVIILGLAL